MVPGTWEAQRLSDDSPCPALSTVTRSPQQLCDALLATTADLKPLTDKVNERTLSDSSIYN